jgi:hypothetical protein
VSGRKLAPDAGYVRVSMFPGVLGMDVARDISRDIAELECSRLVVDLRGHLPMAVSLPRSQPEQRYSSKKLEGAHNPSLMVGEDKANMIR